MTDLLIVITVVLILIIIVQISKASEYVSILKGKEKAEQQSDKVNAWLLMAFLILGLIGIYICHELLKGKLLPVAASVQGAAIDHMIIYTGIITAVVFFLTEIMLFYFGFRYHNKPGRKAKYLPDNDPLEITWTAITALVLLILIVFGLKEWFKITGPAPKNAMVVEVTGKQFEWMFRYPGKDDVLGRKDFKLIDPAKDNPLGQDWSDPANHDDVVSHNVLHLVVDRPVRLLINSQDVIHDVGLPYFRMKMDAVPGTPTTLWFTPTITTAEMIKKTGDPDFVYELACDQLCGEGHFTMRATIIVETQQQFDQWEAGQKSQYQLAMADLNPSISDTTKAADGGLPAADSSKAKVAFAK
ncbi:MAG: cytochrome c oxidase subunit II [Chitinophagaceae bacterium]|jgi:cytochrome c oxidase subunit 2|nr:MAG: cytochrome c oxidase subunit II [Chitinophagaceae bacterium]